MNSILILAAITTLTVIGDYFVKLASLKEGGLVSWTFVLGALLYGLPAVGWFYLMRAHSLAAVAVFYSAATIIFLALLGWVVFRESYGGREVLGLVLALASVLVMSSRG